MSSTEQNSLCHVILCVLCFWTSPGLAGPLDPFSWARSDQIEVNLPWLPFENESRCYGDLGCLNITRDWYHLIHRPFNVFPLPRDVINTRFILYTDRNPRDGQLLLASNESVSKSNFNPSHPTKLIIHGFIDTPLSNWVSEMVAELMKVGGLNVIVVDWAGGSLPLYTQATANTRLVGLEVSHLMNYLIDKHGLDPGAIHIIGHSLGAHTAGYAGERIAGLGRITGLDPAEPYFQGMGKHIRLDPSDAEFVDVIHTDGRSIFLLGYGMSQPCGHIDFFPNNGKEQPGCDITQGPVVPLTLVRDGLEEASRVLLACNHVRAIKLFIDSINGDCQYIGHRCSSYQKFIEGKCFNCAHGCAIMGFHAKAPFSLMNNTGENEVTPQNDPVNGFVPGGKYFMMTGKSYPYCERHYRFTLELARPRIAESWVQGFLSAAIFTDKGHIRGLDLTPSGYARLEHGSTYQVVVTHPLDLGHKIKKIELKWAHDMNVLEPRSICLFWCNDHLYVRTVEVEVMQMPSRGKRNTEVSSKLCSRKKEYADIPNKATSVFYDNCRI